MKIIVSGGTGFIGAPLVKSLLARGDDVAVLTRDPAHVNAGRPVTWSSGAAGEVATGDAVINLAGENVGGGRWTAERKRRILDSRLTVTRKIVDAFRTQPDHKRTLINASAVGFYGVRGDDILDEQASSGGGFLADVVRQWEEAARGAEAVARVAILRFGVVLGREGGALAKMLPPFRLGAGGPLGSGAQWMSWVDRDDVIRMILWTLDHPEARGVYNVTAPEPVQNRELTRELGTALHRPAFVPAPSFALKLLFGEMAEEMLLGGQRVVPARAMREGFSFEYPTLRAALEHALRSQSS
jgi:hypothetical protein